MHRTATIVALSASVILTSGSALAETRQYADLDAFETIDASAGVSVVVSHSENQHVTAEADGPDAFEHLRIEVEDGNLIITQEGSLLDFILDGGLVGALFQSDETITVQVTTPALNRADVSSGATMSVTGFSLESLSVSSSSGGDVELVDLAVESLELISSSGANLEAIGTCSTLDANSSSGANIDATQIECVAGKLSASSGANLSARVTDDVSVDVSSGGHVSVYGGPESTNLNQSSGGSISIHE